MEPAARRTPLRHARWSAAWLSGLLCVLALIGHDAIMTGNPHAAAAPSQPTRSHHAQPLARPMVEHDRSSFMTEPAQPREDPSTPRNEAEGATTPDHDSICTTVHVAAFTSDPSLAADPGMPAALTAALLATTERLCPSLAWDEPTYPPGVKRALIQVYRE